MKVAIHQPQYWPWPRYIHKIAAADVFVYLDTVQFSKNGVQNRNQIKTSQGSLWLTLPVKHKFGQLLYKTKIADRKSLKKHLKILAQSYARTSGYQRWQSELQLSLNMQTDSLCEVAIASTEWLLQKMAIQTQRLRASEMLGVEGQGSTLIASICHALEATSYLTGIGALNYMNREEISDIQVWVQTWNELVYPQAYPGIGFIPDLSTIDILLNCPDDALQMILSAGSWKLLWDLT